MSEAFFLAASRKLEWATISLSVVANLMSRRDRVLAADLFGRKFGLI